MFQTFLSNQIFLFMYVHVNFSLVQSVPVKFEFQCLRNFPISSCPLLYHVLLLNIYDENLQGFEVGMGCLIGNGHPVTKSLSEISGWRQTVWIMIITGLPRKNLANGPFESTFEGSKVANFQKAWQGTPAEWWIGNSPSTFLILLSTCRSLVENMTCSTISFFMSPLVLSSFDMGPSINWVPLTLSLIITS